MGTELLLEKFRQLYGYDDNVLTFFAPGRVSLVGEHTDYNGGHVFPCALTLGITGLVRKRNDRKIRLYSCSVDSDEILEDELDLLVPGRATSKASSGASGSMDRSYRPALIF